ncbi:MAG TPA: AAA family ATPase, partial [Candidatus Wallbacteria bacterium]|nr:AAA family ATPase [Candidatus Wallbacteria bacterium]
NDFPSWFFVNNPKIRPVVISKPDAAGRKPFIALISKAIKGFDECGDVKKKEIITSFVESTEGMHNSDIIAITQLARSEGLGFDSIAEAVRRYKIGVTEDPWARLDKDKIKNAREIIERRIKGQPQAVIKTLDVIKRSVTGLSGAAHSKVSGKPRGVMFFAGPTGTGKTEIAKAVTELIFGDEKAYIRFDMSEFSAEHSDQRLLGAPPGYIGYDAGGELTNAVREKPFSVILFDEIEKAHPKILDKFLQILEDGRLTDGSGNTVYFSESIIVFTSNLGIYRQDETGRKVQNVNHEMDFCKLEVRIRSEIDNYFKLVLGRPEILNRIGENIIVFDFIREDTASQIFNKIMQNIIERLYENNKITLSIPDAICDQIRQICVSDLSNGGRGIGNKIETVFLNPLSRALFDTLIEGRSEDGDIKICSIKAFTEHAGVYSIEI